jgi:CheY-like chemotaxis protein
MHDALIPGASEIAALIRSKDWSRHRLGPIETWPASLRIALTTCLAARSPMQIWWGAPAFTFYNDAFVPWIGAEHPDALGRRGLDIYGPRWEVRQNAIQRLFVENRSVECDGLILFPIFDGLSIEGVLSTFAEDRVGNDLLWAVDEGVRGPLQELARKSPADEHVQDVMRGVDDLLDITRLARGKLMLDRESIDLQTLLAELVRPLGSQAQLESHPTRMLVAADRKRLTRVISQLLRHAVESAGGQVIRVGIERTDDVIRVAITYPGTELPMLRRLPTERILELHHGTLRASANELIIELPASEKIVAAERTPRVLIVEDDDTSARMTQQTLEAFGYAVAIAHDGPVALEVAREFRPDVAVVDLCLPVIDGWEVARRLREKFVDLSIVAMTGMAGDDARQRSQRAGFVEHFFKPVDFESLHRCLSSISASRYPR